MENGIVLTELCFSPASQHFLNEAGHLYLNFQWIECYSPLPEKKKKLGTSQHVQLGTGEGEDVETQLGRKGVCIYV